MQEIDLLESSILTSQRKYKKIIMLYEDANINDKRDSEPIGNAFTNDSDVPSKLLRHQIESYADQLKYICYYE